MLAKLSSGGGLGARSAESVPYPSTAAVTARADRRQAVVAAVAGRIAGFVVKAFDHLIGWQERARERHLLMQLDERMLRDVGLTRSEAAREFSKPFWMS